MVAKQDIVPIRGADIIAKTTLEIVPGMPLSYEWEGHGMKLYIPADALKPDTATLTMSIQASLSGQYQFPEDTELVSGVYWVDFPRRFSQPVTMELQHCACLEHPDQLSSLSFFTAKCNQKTLPYQFQPVPGGVFSTNSSYGAIRVSHFSAFVVALKRWKRKHYTAKIYYLPQVTPTTWIMHFTITRRLKLCLKEVERIYSDQGGEVGPHLDVIFDKEEVSLDIPKDGISLSSGWSLRPLVYPTKVLRESVDNYRRGHPVPACQIQLAWTNVEEPPKELFYLIHVTGVLHLDTHIAVTRPDLSRGLVTSTPQTVRHAATPFDAPSPAQPGSQSQLTPEDFAQFKDPPEMADLMNYVGADCQTLWREIGSQLKLTNLDTIQLETAGQPNAAMTSMSKVFDRWHNGETCEYSWKKLAEVLCSPAVNRPLQLNKMYTELTKKH